ncbi:MAG: AAA family ATPase [Methanomassiliicoccales archaeon]|nr:AAA family ATPase [Methanomassiliicoccales archaeon]NYT15709.1 AAA family ATPase [Methanomassiliicoccales archaeon]
MRITISGPPGSGKTTVCRRLSEMLSIECVISGEVFRQMAKNHDLSLAEFGELAKNDPSYDRMLDDRMLEIARKNDTIILEGRLTAYMLTRNGLEAFKIYLDADIQERASRISKREEIPMKIALERIKERERCEAARYLEYYGIDISDQSVYDLVLDTTNIPAEKVADLILDKVTP